MEKMKLKELINVKTGKLDANASSENGKYPFFTCSKKTLKIDTYSYDCECVLLAGNGDLNVKYYNGKFDAYQRTYILECKDDIISTKYLYYFMKEYLKVLRNQSIGGVIKYIKLVNITEAIIPIYSKEEQKRIVDNLSKVERVLDIKNKQIEELQNFIKSQFVEMFGNKKYIKKCLKDLSITKGKYGSGSPAGEYQEGKPRYIRITDINEDGKLNDNITSPKNEENIEKYILKYGDVLFARTGATVGKTYKYSEEDGYCIYAGYCIKFSMNLKLINPDYLFVFTKTEEYKRWVKNKQRVVAQPNINAEEYGRELVIPVPPITLQNQFAEIVKQIDKQKFESMIQLKMMEKIYNIINDRRRYV